MSRQRQDYKSLMLHPVMGNSIAQFTLYNEGGGIELLEDNIYSYIFMLEGRMTMRDIHFKMWDFAPQTMRVVCKDQILEYNCEAGSVLLEFVPPHRINRFFKSTSTAFSLSCSEPIPFGEDMQQWIAQIWEDSTRNAEIDQRSYCKNLRLILQDSGHIRLATLKVPLRACAMYTNNCAQCQE